MSFFQPNMRMADMIAANHNLILVFPRLGLRLGFGEKSVKEVCDSMGISSEVLLLICNLYTFEDYTVDVTTLRSEDVQAVVAYLKRSHRYYVDERLPHIERHLHHVMSQVEDRYRTLLHQFFSDYCHQVNAHFESEEREVLPYLEKLLEGAVCSPSAAEQVELTHEGLRDTLSDLTQILYKYVPCHNITEEFFEMVTCILQLSGDLDKHALVEEQVILPYIGYLEERKR